MSTKIHTFKKVKILLIEDNPADVRLLKEMFSEVTSPIIKIVHVQTISEIPDELEDKGFDAILLDLSLTDSVGYETFECVKNLTPEIPIIVLTGLDDEQIALRTVRRGAQDYLVKGEVNSTLLMRSILYAIERKETEKALIESERRLRLLIESAEDIISLHKTDGKYIYYNGPIKYGLTQDDVIGKTPFEIYDLTTAEKIVKQIKEVAQTGRSITVDNKYYINEETIWFSEQIFPIKTEDGDIKSVAKISRNVTEQKIAEMHLRDALEERKVLIDEIHHRVKNNLQSLIYLTDMQGEFIPDEESLQKLNELKERIRVMAVIHEKLYKSNNLAQINVNDYIRELAINLLMAYGAKRKVQLKIDIKEVSINTDLAIPCGLIVNELMTNSLKYAFPEDIYDCNGNKDKHVFIKFYKNGKKYTLIVGDNGIGLPEHLEWKKTRSLGLRLVRNWATHELGGSISVDEIDGTKFIIQFRDRKKNRKRF